MASRVEQRPELPPPLPTWAHPILSSRSRQRLAFRAPQPRFTRISVLSATSHTTATEASPAPALSRYSSSLRHSHLDAISHHLLLYKVQQSRITHFGASKGQHVQRSVAQLAVRVTTSMAFRQFGGSPKKALPGEILLVIRKQTVSKTLGISTADSLMSL